MPIQRSEPAAKRVFRREWGCPLTKNRSSWCFHLCDPVGGLGFCGRIAPHALTGRTLRALERWYAGKPAGEKAD